jgi:uncharacterized membrane protein
MKQLSGKIWCIVIAETAVLLSSFVQYFFSRFDADFPVRLGFRGVPENKSLKSNLTTLSHLSNPY